MPAADSEQVHPGSPAEWRAWLDEHHERTEGVWFVRWRAASGRTPVRYEEAVEEALAVGWVDSLGRALDEERTMLWFAPRKPSSAWSRPNKQRIARLEAEGRMGPAGRRAVEVAKANGSWTLLDDVEDLVVPPDLAAAFEARPGARTHWNSFPRSVRRGVLEWIVQAKREPTRAARVQETADAAQRGERAHQGRPRSS